MSARRGSEDDLAAGAETGAVTDIAKTGSPVLLPEVVLREARIAKMLGTPTLTVGARRSRKPQKLPRLRRPGQSSTGWTRLLPDCRRRLSLVDSVSSGVVRWLANAMWQQPVDIDTCATYLSRSHCGSQRSKEAAMRRVVTPSQ